MYFSVWLICLKVSTNKTLLSLLFVQICKNKYSYFYRIKGNFDDFAFIFKIDVQIYFQYKYRKRRHCVLLRIECECADILFWYICIPRHESRPGARKGGCTLSSLLSPRYSCVHTRVQGQVVWRGFRMGARTHGGPAGSCGLDPTMHWHKKKGVVARSDETGGREGKDDAGVDIIMAWWRTIRGRVSLRSLGYILTSLV